LTSFVGIDQNKKFGNHKNGIKFDNRLDNLEWSTRSENMKHAYRTGLQSQLGEKNTQSKLIKNDIIKIKLLLKENKLNQKEIGKLFNISNVTVSKINTGKLWSYIKVDK